MDYGPFPGGLGKLWKGVGGGDLRSLLSGKGGALAASLCSSEALCPLWVTSRLPQCSHQALGIHAPKGIQFGSTKQWWHLRGNAASPPFPRPCQTAQWTQLLYSAFVPGAQAFREE